MIGQTIAHYRIVEKIASGGMGEVYRARDTRLERDVAIKVLLPVVANDPDRLARLSREARVLAALNHPHIAQVHGLEQADGAPAVVMEFVEGPTLADRIARGPIPVDEALPIAKQIAEALEAAHEQNIIHRDLKPANIKLRTDGTVKVLDFGLAKAITPTEGRGPGDIAAPTATAHVSVPGLILGTAAYMSPEQAKGATVDRRGDIWAFGCVLFEMLAGTRAFSGDDLTDTLIAVLSKEPAWERLPAEAAGMRPLLARCLKKDPKQRLQAIGDVRLLIEELMSGTSQAINTHSAVASSQSRIALIATASLTGGALIAALVTWIVIRGPTHVPAQPARFEILPSSAQALTTEEIDRDIAISPDGHSVVYVSASGPGHLVVRPINRVESYSLPGIIGARSPFFSADSRWIGFFQGSSLKKVSITGGAVTTICQSSTVPRGATWGDDGNIVFATYAGELLRVSASGGEPIVVAKPDVAKGENHYWHPLLLPGGRGILFTVMATPFDPAQVVVLDSTGKTKTLIRNASQPEYVATGHLLYMAAGTLYAVRFDLGRLEVFGDPAPVGEDVSMGSSAAGNYAVSRSGTLVYIPGARTERQRSLVWVDRKGRVTPIKARQRAYSEAVLSPDGTRVAVAIRDQQRDIHILNLASGHLTQVTFGPGEDNDPVWTSDGQRIVFASRSAGPSNLYAQSADGTGAVERLTIGPDSHAPSFVAPDGMGVLGTEISPRTAGDIVWFPLKRSTSQSAQSTASAPRPSPVERLVHSSSIEYNPEISPNGRYIAYQSNETGQNEIYVRPFPRVNDGRWKVSTSGGTRPVWVRNGRELIYLDLANILTAVPVQVAGEKFVHGSPAKVFDIAYPTFGYGRSFDVSSDGQRFLMIKEDTTAATKPPGFTVVLNWFDELKAKVP